MIDAMTLINALILAFAVVNLAIVVTTDDVAHRIDPEEEAYDVQELDAVFDSVTGRRRYDHYQLWHVVPKNEADVNIINFLKRGSIEIWNTGAYNETHVEFFDILVPPMHTNTTWKFLECSGLETTVIFEDLQREINLENEPAPVDVTTRNRGICSTNTGLNWDQYYRFDKIDAFTRCLAQNFPDRVKLFEIGRTNEGRPMNLLKVTRAGNKAGQRPAIYIDGGIHAREWVSPSAVTYMMNEFVENQNKYANVFDKYDVYILPVANPDGYEHSHLVDRMWRKTRSSHHGRSCRGVDPNRNWGFQWRGKGASSNPCDETYHGPQAFSEPETNSIKNFILQRKDNIKMYLTFHSYGQYILYPWGFDRVDAVDKDDLQRVGVAGAEAISRISNRSYRVGSAAKMLYPAAGGSDDWAKGAAGIKYSYTIELLDTGRHGFLLPAKFAKNAGIDATTLTVAMINAI